MGLLGALDGIRKASLRPKRPLGMALGHGTGKESRIQHALAQRAGGLFTLRASRRGHWLFGWLDDCSGRVVGGTGSMRNYCDMWKAGLYENLLEI